MITVAHESSKNHVMNLLRMRISYKYIDILINTNTELDVRIARNFKSNVFDLKLSHVILMVSFT